jgi:hypothetical protein
MLIQVHKSVPYIQMHTYMSLFLLFSKFQNIYSHFKFGCVIDQVMTVKVNDGFQFVSGPKQLRITSGGKIKFYVTFTLDFFKVSSALEQRDFAHRVQEYNSKPLVLHAYLLPYMLPNILLISHNIKQTRYLQITLC